MPTQAALATSKEYALAHQRIVAGHVLHQRRCDVAVLDISLASKYNRALRVVEQVLDALGMIDCDNACKGLGVLWAFGVKRVMSEDITTFRSSMWAIELERERMGYVHFLQRLNERVLDIGSDEDVFGTHAHLLQMIR